MITMFSMNCDAVFIPAWLISAEFVVTGVTPNVRDGLALMNVLVSNSD